ncbi:MAG TPA: universal stress protein [Pseudomonadales bacterium]|nr:universal stress protein [Pseudomonadales bacterium]
MKKIRNILVVMDMPRQTQTALARAEKLAKHFGAHLHLVSFVHHDMYDQKDVFDTHQRNEIRKTLEHERGEWLQKRLRDAKMLAMDVDTEVVWERHIHEWIVDACKAERFDLVLKTANRSRTLMHMPTDWHLLRECPAPIWLASQTRGAPKPIVLATVDPTRRDRAHKALDKKVLDAATSYAKTHDAEVHIGWCVETPEVLADLDIIDARKYEKKMLATMKPRLQELAAAFDIPAKRIHTPGGHTEKSMAGLAAQLKAELIVLGTAARTGVSGMVVGNTAEKVLSGVRCDMLTVRP